MIDIQRADKVALDPRGPQSIPNEGSAEYRKFIENLLTNPALRSRLKDALREGGDITQQAAKLFFQAAAYQINEKPDANHSKLAPHYFLQYIGPLNDEATLALATLASEGAKVLPPIPQDLYRYRVLDPQVVKAAAAVEVCLEMLGTLGAACAKTRRRSDFLRLSVENLSASCGHTFCLAFNNVVFRSPPNTDKYEYRKHVIILDDNIDWKGIVEPPPVSVRIARFFRRRLGHHQETARSVAGLAFGESRRLYWQKPDEN